MNTENEKKKLLKKVKNSSNDLDRFIVIKY